ncbi:hypothetical protein ABW20_dc0110543 [Dactylellina cionopaga]|nr:hypothetical protein ABW20_dc0110543 [Dactylellina cionopaga]
MDSKLSSVPHISPALHHVSTPSQVEAHFFGSTAPLKPTIASTSIKVPSGTVSPSPKAPTKSPALKTPIPAKTEYLAYSMAVETPSPVPTKAVTAHKGIFGWGMPAEIAFLISLAILGICLPIGLFLFLRRRKRQSKESINETTSQTNENIDIEGTLRGSTTRPPTASSWLEMLKHRTDTPAPPHANDESKDDEIYYEPPKPVSFARRKFCTRLSGRMSEADIEREVRELDEEVRRRSKMSRSRGQSVGVLPDPEDPCNQCAKSYTHDERGHTQPVEGRKCTPVPFLGTAELDGSEVSKDTTEEEKSEEKDCDRITETIRIVEDSI